MWIKRNIAMLYGVGYSKGFINGFLSWYLSLRLYDWGLAVFAAVGLWLKSWTPSPIWRGAIWRTK